MKIILALMLLYLFAVSAAPMRKEAECRDQYGHCPEWSKAEYCNKKGYKTYMTLMCAFSCNTCNVFKQSKDPELDDITSASGLEDTTSANESTSGEDEGDKLAGGDGHEVQGEAIQAEENKQTKEVKDASQFKSRHLPKQIPERHQRQSVSEENTERYDVTSDQPQQKAATEDRDPPGVQEVTFQDNIDDEVNPRSKISNLPKNTPSDATSQSHSKSQVQDKEISNEQESTSGSGIQDKSAESAYKENKIESTKSGDKTESEGESGEESEELKDIAGDIKTGSKIFEADISEAESTSGCSSGYGCFSGNGEQIQSDKAEESLELDPRSKIAVVPYKKITIKMNSGLENHHIVESQSVDESEGDQGVNRENVRDPSSGSGAEIKDDVQSTNNDKGAEGYKTVASSNSEMESTKESELSVKSQSAAKSQEKLEVDEPKLVVSDPSTVSGAEVKDDIQSIDKDADDQGNIDGVKSADKSSSSGIDATTKTESQIENQRAKSDENEKVNEAMKDNSSGSGEDSIDTNPQSIGKDANEEDIDGSKSATKSKNAQPAATEEQDIEDALLVKNDISNDDSGSGLGSGHQGRIDNEDLSSPKTRQRITSMEQLITDDKTKIEKVKDVPANARENVPHTDERDDDFIDSDIGRGHKVTLILDQHYYKPYSNEDSMAYEMLALDLKKEVERAVGNQAIVSQISFSEIRKPGKLPRFSRVLAKFMLHGDRKVLHNAVRKGMVGDMTVDKHFFRVL